MRADFSRFDPRPGANQEESALMARRACSAYRGRNRSPSRVPVRVRGDPGRRSVPRREPSRSAHRPASPRQAAAQRGVVEEGAVLRVVVGHESAPMAQRARPAHRVRSRSPSWVPRRARDDSGRRTSEALTGGSAQPYLPQMSLPGGRPYPRGRGGPARRLGGGHGDPNTTPRAARVLEARARVEAQRNRGSLA